MTREPPRRGSQGSTPNVELARSSNSRLTSIRTITWWKSELIALPATSEQGAGAAFGAKGNVRRCCPKILGCDLLSGRGCTVLCSQHLAAAGSDEHHKPA